MRKIVINGPTKITGTYAVQGSKNAVLVNLILPILTKETCVIKNVPRIGDVLLNLEILRSLGAQVVWLDPHQVSITCKELKNNEISPELAVRTTGSRFFIPILVLRFGAVVTGMSLGDNIGNDRGFNDFINMLGQFRIKHEKIGTKYRFYLDTGVKAVNTLNLDYPSFSGTVGAVLTSVRGKGHLVINVANRSPETDNVLAMLRSMGAEIVQQEDLIKVFGKSSLHGTVYNNLSDHNVLVTYSLAALITNSPLTINGFSNTKLEAFWSFLKQINARYSLDSGGLALFPCYSQLKPIKLFADAWPQFHSDWQPLAAPLLSIIPGESTITDNIWADRFGYFVELEKMGAKGELFKPKGTRFNDQKPHGLRIHGKAGLTGSKVNALDVRGGAGVVLAGMVAQGETVIENVAQIERGYEDLVKNLSLLGAAIRYEE